MSRPDGHVPARPSWECSACGRPWPCAPARAELSEAFDPVELGVLAGERLAEAAGDLPALSPEQLFERFLGWTRPRRPT
ncbi:MAG TPA: hypothetical protein VF755_24035 [Catenuloplanes sp.]